MEPIEITETPNMIVELNNDSAYPGRGYISLKRPCGDLAELGEDEILDFLKLINAMENSLKKSRYNHAVKVGGTDFKDAEFSCHYNNNRHFNTGPEVLNKIAGEIRRNL